MKVRFIVKMNTIQNAKIKKYINYLNLERVSLLNIIKIMKLQMKISSLSFFQLMKNS